MADTKKVAKIQIDKDACLGCGTCVVINPQAFDLGEDGKSSVKDGALASGDENLLMAAQSCPVGAISLWDEEGNRIFPPQKE